MGQFVLLALAGDPNEAVVEIFLLSPSNHDLGCHVPPVSEYRLNRDVQVWERVDEAGPNGLSQLADFALALATMGTYRS